MNKIFFAHILPCLLMALVVLPRDARVRTNGIPGKDWTQTGDMNCAVAAAVRQWDSALGHHGWKKKDSMKLNRSRYVSVWEKSGRKITLLLWEKEIGKSGFSWGELTEQKTRNE